MPVDDLESSGSRQWSSSIHEEEDKKTGVQPYPLVDWVDWALMITLIRMMKRETRRAQVLGRRSRPEDGGSVTVSIPGQRSDQCQAGAGRNGLNAVYNLQRRQKLAELRDLHRKTGKTESI